MAKKVSYLKTVKFDHNLKKLFIAKYLLNFRYVLLLIIAIIALGAFSFLNLPRRLNPEVKIPVVSVSASLPGAGPQDIESLVTIPIEDEVAGLEGVTKISSTSLENLSFVTVEFESSINPDKARDSVKGAVDGITTLPQEAKTPKVQKLDFENQPVWNFLVTSSSDQASLMQFSKDLKDKIEKLPSVKSVNTGGLEDQEIEILTKPNIQRSFNIDPQALSQAIQASIRSHPAGSINTQNSSFALTVDPSITSVDELRQTPISLAGQSFRLGDVAIITQKSKPDQAKTYFASAGDNPTRAVSFSIFKSESANISKTVDDVKKLTDTVIEKGGQFKLITVTNSAKLVDDQFKDLTTSFRDTIFLVLVTLFIFLGLRQALVVAFAIPLSFLVAFTVMRITGLSINFLSLFSLILALGLLVDDAIVIVTAVTVYYREKRFTPPQTGLLVLRDFFVPIWSTTITAVWAFLPLLIASGIIGEFIKSISIVVSTTLIASTAIAILITLPTMMLLLKPNFPNRVRLLLYFIGFLLTLALVVLTTLKSPLLPLNIIATVALIALSFYLRKHLARELNMWLAQIVDTKKIADFASRGVINSQKLADRYQRLIDRVLASPSARRKTLIVVVAFALFSYLLVPLGLVVNEFFPKTDADALFTTVELPSGTNLETTQQEVQNLLEKFRNTKDTNYVVAEVGKTISTTDFFAPQGKSNSVLFTFVLPKKNSIAIADNLRQSYKDYTKGKLSVVEQTGGPPAGADLQIKLFGDDLATLDKLADQITGYLSSEPGLTNVDKSIKSGTSKIVFVPDRLKLAGYGLNENTLGQQLRTYASGFTLDSNAKFTGSKTDITFRNSDQTQSPETLASIPINTQSGSVPLASLGTFKLAANPTQITREDQTRTLSVTAGVLKGFPVTKENKKLADFAKTLKLPAGYSWKTGGVNEENQKSVNSIFQAMLIAFILIATTMVLQFGSYRKAAVVMLLIPLAISGVFVIFALTSTPLSFPTLIGILALFGIVVYQSMLIVDKINRNLTFGMKLKDAISDACASRVEPIMFGTITTVVGLIPITLSNPLWRGLGGAIIAGMLFSGAIMLLFIPVVYYLIYQKEVK